MTAGRCVGVPYIKASPSTVKRGIVVIKRGTSVLERCKNTIIICVSIGLIIAIMLVGFAILNANSTRKEQIQQRIDSLDPNVCCFIGVGKSMYPTIKSGDISIATTDFDVTALVRGTLVVFSFDTVIEYDVAYDFEGHPNVVTKRIIGLPGDVLFFDDTTSTLFINGCPYDEPYLFDRDYEWNIGEYTVPDGCYFVMGDNRNHSVDSRMFGCVSANQITHIITAVVSDSDLEAYLSP